MCRDLTFGCCPGDARSPRLGVHGWEDGACFMKKAARLQNSVVQALTRPTPSVGMGRPGRWRRRALDLSAQVRIGVVQHGSQ
jgi:hypothetical protein